MQLGVSYHAAKEASGLLVQNATPTTTEVLSLKSPPRGLRSPPILDPLLKAAQEQPQQQTAEVPLLLPAGSEALNQAGARLHPSAGGNSSSGGEPHFTAPQVQFSAS